MAAHPTETDSVPIHIDWQNFLKGSLTYSPGNQDLLGPVDAALGALHAVQQAQDSAGDLDQQLRGGDHIVILLLDPVVRELEKIEKAYIASPAGKSWTPVFATSAANLLGRATQAQRDQTLQDIDAVVTGATCPTVFKDAGKRFHGIYKLHAAILDKAATNAAAQTANQQAATDAKSGSNAVSRQVEGNLTARHPGERAFNDAHFKPTPPKKKKVDPKLEELQKKVDDLTAQNADLQKQNTALSALLVDVQTKNGDLQKQLADLTATAEVYRKQLADIQAQAGTPPAQAPAAG